MVKYVANNKIITSMLTVNLSAVWGLMIIMMIFYIPEYLAIKILLTNVLKQKMWLDVQKLSLLAHFIFQEIPF